MTLVIPGQKYRHVDNEVYEVVCLAFGFCDCTSVVVVYKNQYGGCHTIPLRDFFDLIATGDTVTQRFTLIEEDGE